MRSPCPTICEGGRTSPAQLHGAPPQLAFVFLEAVDKVAAGRIFTDEEGRCADMARAKQANALQFFRLDQTATSLTNC